MDKSSGELVTLTPNNNNTVQPVALMRLGVFVPTLKSLKNSKKNTLSRTDATEELTRLSLARAEGFDKVEITGPRLDMDNDFRHCCKVSDEAAFCLIQRPYISKTLLTRRISPRGSP